MHRAPPLDFRNQKNMVLDQKVCFFVPIIIFGKKKKKKHFQNSAGGPGGAEPPGNCLELVNKIQYNVFFVCFLCFFLKWLHMQATGLRFYFSPPDLALKTMEIAPRSIYSDFRRFAPRPPRPVCTGRLVCTGRPVPT